MVASRGRVLAGFLAVSGLTCALLLGARADESLPESGGSDTAPAPGPKEEEVWKPFELYPTGPGAIKYEELLDELPPPSTEAEKDKEAVLDPERRRVLSTDTKASIDAVTRWAAENNGPEVHDAWSAYTDQMVEKAQITEASYAAGLAGIGEAGLP